MRILLVDDDAGVVQALDAILKTMPGDTVRTAGSGDEALAAAAEMGGLELLITDVVMEPMDGFTLRDHLLTQFPGTRVILISGYDLSDYPAQTEGYQLLAKPIEADALRAAVAKERPAPAPVAETAPAPAPAPVAAPVVPAEPEPQPAPIAAVPVAAPTPAPEPVAASLPEPTPAPEPAPVPPPVAAPVSAPVPVAAPKAVPVPAAPPAPAATPVNRPTVVAKAVPVPTGTPVARPSATPTVMAVPVAKAPPAPTNPGVSAVPASGVRAVPAATPKAVPTAQPAVTVKATAVPRPSGVAPAPVAPTAVPAAAPMAVPVPPAAPSAVPGAPTVRVAATVKAQPVPPPSAPGDPVPAARPVSAVVPSPVAKPVAHPTVKTAAIPAPRGSGVQTKTVSPSQAPQAGPAGTVVATAVSAPSAVVPPTAPAPFVGTGEDLSGTMLGVYLLHRKTSEGRWGGVYAGLQTSINRPVSLEVLDPAKAANPVTQARFVADARAKAGVQHPSILAVYEAGEADGRFFYAYEYVDGQSLADLKGAGQRVDEITALKILRVTADGLAYFGVHHAPHSAPDASNIYLGADREPRLGNIATQLADEQLAPQPEIQALGRIMLTLLPAIQTLSPGLREILKRMVQAGPQAFTAWGQVLQAIKAIEPKVVPTDAAKISAHDRAAIAAVELARNQQKRALYINLGSLASLVCLIAFVVWFFVLRNKERITDEQVLIPAGEFIFTNGEKISLPDFWIDKYEVTFGQYAKFVKHLEGYPTSEFDHPQQPRSKTALMHRPPNWAIYYGQAAAGGKARSIPIDLACPVMEVDFWDAYAYAKWKSKVTGREYDLPSEQEWEKAARGTKGFIYPWGDEPNPKKVNSNADYNENPLGKSGHIDGYGFWNPVDKEKGDKSPFGVMGMAGNVREWTGTWDKVKKRPVVKGGSFMSSDVRLDQRTDLDPGSISESIGFRTVARTPPTAKK